MTVTLCADTLATLRDPSDLAPLYYRYPGQINPQPAHIEMDEDGEVSASWDGSTGGTPAHVWHGRTLRWAVPANMRGIAVADLLEGQALPLLQRVRAGHSVDWDGSNHRGHLTDDARDASEALESLCYQLQDEQADMAPVWDVGDWLFTSCSLDQHWHHQPLADAVATIEADAQREGVTLVGDVAECLLSDAESKFDEGGGDGLTAAHLAALVQSGRIAQDQADARNA